jgi:hypothetical protein
MPSLFDKPVSLKVKLSLLSPYVADTIQIEKLDAAGNTLGITKVNELSSITIDTMKSVFTSPTTVNVEKNTAALTTIYTAVATDDNIVAYTLKSGFQKSLFYRYSNKLLCLITCRISGNNSNFVIACLSLFFLIL